MISPTPPPHDPAAGPPSTDERALDEREINERTLDEHGSETRTRGAPSRSLEPFLASRGAVLCVLFFVTGALGLPLLWASPRFSWPERIFWAIVVTVYTFLLIALVAWVLSWTYRQIF